MSYILVPKKGDILYLCDARGYRTEYFTFVDYPVLFETERKSFLIRDIYGNDYKAISYPLGYDSETSTNGWKEIRENE